MRDFDEREDPQPGMSTFDRNHPASFVRHEPVNLWQPAGDLAKRLRDRIAEGKPSDADATMMLEAAVLLERLRVNADIYRSWWIESARKEASRGTA